jgi:uncharacterized phage-like protein YoqJ|nr:MAG TPA: Protein of unknown function (DUF1273) [Bacteriophage sp.]
MKKVNVTTNNTIVKAAGMELVAPTVAVVIKENARVSKRVRKSLVCKRREEVKKAKAFAAYVTALKKVAQNEPAVVPSDNRKSQKKRAGRAQQRCIVAAKELLQQQRSNELEARKLRREKGLVFKPIGLITRKISPIEKAALSVKPSQHLLESVNVLDNRPSINVRCVVAHKMKKSFIYTMKVTSINRCGIFSDIDVKAGAVVETGVFNAKGSIEDFTKSLVKDICLDTFVFDFGELKGSDITDAFEELAEMKGFADLLPTAASPSQIRGNQLILCREDLGYAVIDRVHLLTGKLTAGKGELSVGKAAKLLTRAGQPNVAGKELKIDLDKEYFIVVDSFNKGDNFDGQSFHNHEWFCEGYGLPFFFDTYHQSRLMYMAKEGSQPLSREVINRWGKELVVSDKAYICGNNAAKIGRAKDFKNIWVVGNVDGECISIHDLNGWKASPAEQQAAEQEILKVMAFTHETPAVIGSQPLQFTMIDKAHRSLIAEYAVKQKVAEFERSIEAVLKGGDTGLAIDAGLMVDYNSSIKNNVILASKMAAIADKAAKILEGPSFEGQKESRSLKGVVDPTLLFLDKGLLKEGEVVVSDRTYKAMKRNDGLHQLVCVIFRNPHAGEFYRARIISVSMFKKRILGLQVKYNLFTEIELAVVLNAVKMLNDNCLITTGTDYFKSCCGGSDYDTDSYVVCVYEDAAIFSHRIERSVHIPSEMGADKIVVWNRHDQLVVEVWKNAMKATKTDVGSYATIIAKSSGLLAEPAGSAEVKNAFKLIKEDALSARKVAIDKELISGDEEVQYEGFYEEGKNIGEKDISNEKLQNIYLSYVQSHLTPRETMRWLLDILLTGPAAMGMIIDIPKTQLTVNIPSGDLFERLSLMRKKFQPKIAENDGKFVAATFDFKVKKYVASANPSTCGGFITSLGGQERYYISDVLYRDIMVPTAKAMAEVMNRVAKELGYKGRSEGERNLENKVVEMGNLILEDCRKSIFSVDADGVTVNNLKTALPYVADMVASALGKGNKYSLAKEAGFIYSENCFAKEYLDELADQFGEERLYVPVTVYGRDNVALNMYRYHDFETGREGEYVSFFDGISSDNCLFLSEKICGQFELFRKGNTAYVMKDVRDSFNAVELKGRIALRTRTENASDEIFKLVKWNAFAPVEQKAEFYLMSSSCARSKGALWYGKNKEAIGDGLFILASGSNKVPKGTPMQVCKFDKEGGKYVFNQTGEGKFAIKVNIDELCFNYIDENKDSKKNTILLLMTKQESCVVLPDPEKPLVEEVNETPTVEVVAKAGDSATKSEWLSMDNYKREEGAMVICATGHRSDKLGCGKGDDWSSKSPKLQPVRDRIEAKLRSILDFQVLAGEKKFELISGMALGVDQLFFSVGNQLRKEYAEQGITIVLTAAVPCIEQDGIWKDDCKISYAAMLKAADKKVRISNKKYEDDKGCMQRRNRFMVDNADMVLAYHDGSEGGTKNCIDYAKSIGAVIENAFEGPEENK